MATGIKRDYPVPFETWKIGMEFRMSGRRWRVTDVGTRTIVAIKLGRQRYERGETKADDDPSWYNGPPYSVQERVIDEYDLMACSLEKPDGTE